jgi:hypothetical protein
MPVSVYGYVGDQPFAENTESINVSLRGGLVAISQTDEDLECRIVRLMRSGTGQILAGLEFPDVEPKFWRTGSSPLNY